MNARPLKLVVWLLVAAALLFLLWISLKPTRATPTEQAPATAVALSKVESVQVVPHLEAIGRIEAQREVLIAPEVAGNVTELSFDSGNNVRAGQVLLRLNDAPEQAKFVEAQSDFSAAQARLQRQRELLATGGTSRQTFEDAQARYDNAKGEVGRLQAVIAQKHVKAPFDGLLGIRQVHLGQYLNPGTPVTTLTDLSQLRVNFSLAEQDGAAIQQGQKVSIRVDAWPDAAFDGHITAIDPKIDLTHTVAVQATLDDPQHRLRPGMYARVQVALAPRDELLIPETAVAYSAYGEYAFIASQEDGNGLTVKKVNVHIDERRGGKAVVASGLKAGQQVAVSGQLRLRDGMPVRPVASALGQ